MKQAGADTPASLSSSANNLCCCDVQDPWRTVPIRDITKNMVENSNGMAEPPNSMHTALAMMPPIPRKNISI